jgi:predicted peroxiredoxin
MKLGIFINTDRHLAYVIGITKAAISKGHEVIMFNMDDGIKLFGNPIFADLCKTEGVSMSFCSYNAKSLGVATEGLSHEIVCGSQYNNAVMVNSADRVIVL